MCVPALTLACCNYAATQHAVRLQQRKQGSPKKYPAHSFSSPIFYNLTGIDVSQIHQIDSVTLHSISGVNIFQPKLNGK